MEEIPRAKADFPGQGNADMLKGKNEKSDTRRQRSDLCRLQQRILRNACCPWFGNQRPIQSGQLQPVALRQSHEVRIGCILVARQHRQQSRLHVIDHEPVTAESAQRRERFSRIVKGGMISGRHADPHKPGFCDRTGCPVVDLEQPAEQRRVVDMAFPAASE